MENNHATIRTARGGQGKRKRQRIAPGTVQSADLVVDGLVGRTAGSPLAMARGGFFELNKRAGVPFRQFLSRTAFS